MNNQGSEEAPPPVEVTPNSSQPELIVKNEQLLPAVIDINKRLMENYEKYCHIRYKDIISKRPDLLQNNDLVTKIIVEEWEKKTNEEMHLFKIKLKLQHTLTWVKNLNQHSNMPKNLRKYICQMKSQRELKLE